MSKQYIHKSKYPDFAVPEVSVSHYLFDSWKSLPENHVALVDPFNQTQLTYKELERGITRVACHLYERGMRKGDVFAIYSPNTILYPVVFHGVALIGGINTTVNPLYTVEELVNQLKDSDAKYLVTVSMFADKAKEAAEKYGKIREVFSFDKCEGLTPFQSLLTTPPKSNLPRVKINPKVDPIVIPYSSGTTGLPKGVVLTHYNLLSNVLQVTAVEKDWKHTDTFIGVLPFFHIYALVLVMHISLKLGVKIVVMPKFDLEPFLSIVQKYKITHAHIVPPIILGLAKHPIVDKFDLSSLRMILSAAAPLTSEVENACRHRLNVTIKQAYGMTELSPGTHIVPSEKVVPGSVGVLLPNQIAKIINEQGETVPPGEEGELCIKGPNVMKGYLNRPDATKAMIDKDGFLHTGDIAKVDKDGYYFIVDRVKELIKYKGFQVAPAELEGILLGHPSIADAAVIPVPEVECGELPKAFIVIKPGQNLTADEIHKWIEDKVAPHKKLRGGIEFVDMIPKSAAGKILRRILKDQEKIKTQKAKL